MYFYVLNTNFDRIAIIDTFESAIWTDRAYEAGDFQLSLFPTAENITNCQQDRYVENIESDHLMVIEKIQLTSNNDDGDKFIISGYSLEKILSRRIIWANTTLTGSLQDGIRQLITDAVISPSISERAIPNFVFESSTDSRITSLILSKECKRGDNLYDTISSICKEYEIDFKVTLNSSKQLVFKLYIGEDRSYAQSANPYVVFSRGFENIISSEHVSSKEDSKNVCLVTHIETSESEDNKEETISTIVGSAEGLMRRETYVEASDVPTKNSHDVDYTEEERKVMMAQAGVKELGENKEETTFEGEVDPNGSFVYGRDFYLGDIVQVEDSYGMNGVSLVKEIIWSQDKDGTKCYPTFEAKDLDTDGYLFFNGDQYRSRTGGWVIYNQGNPKCDIEIGTVLKMTPTDETWDVDRATFGTNNKIDLTGYKTLHAELIGTGHIYINPVSRAPDDNAVRDLHLSIERGNQFEIDVADINQGCYICFGPWPKPHYIEAYKIWLTR